MTNMNGVGLQDGSHFENLHHIFEVVVINSLERESVFVQIKSDFNCEGTYNNYYGHTIVNTIQTLPINKVKEEARIIKAVVKPNVLANKAKIGSENNDIYPGFVRIAPFQSLPISVVIKDRLRNGYIAFITVNVADPVSNKITCLANQLQINEENIEIKRSENGNIVIKAICYKENEIDNILSSWGIPHYLINSMKHNGWDNIGLWHEITESDLMGMGFQRGHRLIFFDKFTDLLRSSDNKCIHIKHILKSWHLPIDLYSNMVDHGWVDPCDWAEITDHHFQKMGFKDGHVIKFRKQVKNNHHLIAYQQMQSEYKEKMQSESTNEDVIINDAHAEFKQSELIVPSLLKNIASNGAFFGSPPVSALSGGSNRGNATGNARGNAVTFTIEASTITHEQFWYKLDEIGANKRYYAEIKYGNNAWLRQKDEITDTKRRTVCELDTNIGYYIRIRCENKVNKRSNKAIYSCIREVKTKDEKWRNIHLPKIPDFKYAVASNNKQITVEFDPLSLTQIKQTKFDERYSLNIGLSKNISDGSKITWHNVATLRKDQIVYKYNVNDQKDADLVHVGISSRNDLGQRYNQCTRTRKFPFNQVIKRINTTKHGNNLQFNESMTVATKIDQDYQYSTFAFGSPVTREMCIRYDMYVKVNKVESDCMIGFAPSIESVNDWNQALGYGGNKNSSVGVLANKSSANFAVYNKDQDKRYIYHAVGGANAKQWDDGSVFVLSFDFENDDCNIYLHENKDGGNNDHNTLDRNRLLTSIKLNQVESVIPSFSLNSQGDSIEVVKWRLY